MGSVLAGHHLFLDEPVAIKVLPAHALSAEAVARFEREARAAVKIKSEHVVRVLDVGRLESGAPYMVMEFLDGEDLSKRLRRTGPLPVSEAVDYVMQACVAMADAHTVGIVHRDLKPSNLFCVRRSDGRTLIKVLDFGISKHSQTGSSFAEQQVTRTGAVLGSPLYMSPEQFNSARNVDARSDIWSLGVVLYELLCGVVPFPGEAIGEVAIKIATQAVPPVRVQREDVPRELDSVIGRCLAKEPAERFANVAEFARALRPFASREVEPLVERIARIVQSAGNLTSTSTLSEASPTLPLSRVGRSGTVGQWSSTRAVAANKWARGGAIGGGASLIGVALVFAARHWGTSAPAPSVSAAIAPSASIVSVPRVSTAAPTPSVSTLPTVAVSALPSVSALPTTHVTATATASAVRQTPPPRSATVRTTKAQPTPGVAACDPPFSVDELGRKRFKPQCFVNSP